MCRIQLCRIQVRLLGQQIAAERHHGEGHEHSDPSREEEPSSIEEKRVGGHTFSLVMFFLGQSEALGFAGRELKSPPFGKFRPGFLA
jgi:hypothetical protein